MSLTRITKEEWLRLKELMNKEKPKIERIEPKKQKVKFYLGGGSKHRKIALYLLDKLKNKYVNYKTEKTIYIKELKKGFRIDIILYTKDNKKLLVECGFSPKEKINILKQYYKVLHLNYKDFETLQRSKEIRKQLREAIE